MYWSSIGLWVYEKEIRRLKTFLKRNLYIPLEIILVSLHIEGIKQVPALNVKRAS